VTHAASFYDIPKLPATDFETLATTMRATFMETPAVLRPCPKCGNPSYVYSVALNHHVWGSVLEVEFWHTRRIVCNVKWRKDK